MKLRCSQRQALGAIDPRTRQYRATARGRVSRNRRYESNDRCQFRDDRTRSVSALLPQCHQCLDLTFVQSLDWSFTDNDCEIFDDRCVLGDCFRASLFADQFEPVLPRAYQGRCRSAKETRQRQKVTGFRTKRIKTAFAVQRRKPRACQRYRVGIDQICERLEVTLLACEQYAVVRGDVFKRLLRIVQRASGQPSSRVFQPILRLRHGDVPSIVSPLPECRELLLQPTKRDRTARCDGSAEQRVIERQCDLGVADGLKWPSSLLPGRFELSGPVSTELLSFRDCGGALDATEGGFDVRSATKRCC